jgi:hypothetical protein
MYIAVGGAIRIPTQELERHICKPREDLVLSDRPRLPSGVELRVAADLVRDRGLGMFSISHPPSSSYLAPFQPTHSVTKTEARRLVSLSQGQVRQPRLSEDAF